MDRRLISELRLSVGDRLQEWVSQQQRTGPALSRDDQRAYASFGQYFDRIEHGVIWRDAPERRITAGTIVEKFRDGFHDTPPLSVFVGIGCAGVAKNLSRYIFG